MKEEKSKKDVYEKTLAAYGAAVQEFQKRKYQKAAGLFKAFLENHPLEREIVDRARMYLSICQNETDQEKDVIPLKTFHDHYHHAVYKINMWDYEEALGLLEIALHFKSTDKDKGKIHYLLANVHCRMNNPEESLENLKKAVQLDKFFRILAQNEVDFQPLWEDKKFKLITRMT